MKSRGRGWRPEGEGTEGKERARPVRPRVINPFRAMQSEPGRQEARVPPSHGQAKPSPPRSRLCQTGARSGCNAAGPEDPAPRLRESDGQGSRDGHHGRHLRPPPEARSGACGDPLFRARDFIARPFPSHGRAVSELVCPDVEGASGKDRVETESVPSPHATSTAGSRVTRTSTAGRRRAAASQQGALWKLTSLPF